MPQSTITARGYKVKDGDTLKSIAAENGISWQALAKFNFGTDDPAQMDMFFRTQVGATTLDTDGKSYIFSGKDDPGIIYIPENMPPHTFASSATHTITVKPITQKTFVPAKVMVQFRPKVDWDGEFGFDWMRIKNPGEPNRRKESGDIYKEKIAGGSNVMHPGPAKQEGSRTAVYIPSDENRKEAYEALKTEYRIIPSYIDQWGSDELSKGLKPKYYVPYLNLYPKGTPGTPTPPFEAELVVLVTVQGDEPERIVFDYDKTLFEIDKPTLSDKAPGDQRVASDKTVKITCIKEFDADQEIKVKAYPKGWRTDDDIIIAGMIIVCKNSAPYRHTLKFVLVKVKTHLDTEWRTGVICDGEKKHLSAALHQALIHAEIEDGPDLDLTNNPDFKVHRGQNNEVTFGKYIYRRIDEFDQKVNGGLNHELNHFEIFTTVKNIYLCTPGNEKYKTGNYFTVFSFDQFSFIRQLGTIHDYGIHNLFLYHRDTNDYTNRAMSHEALHGLGLNHTHWDWPLLSNAHYLFDRDSTDNIMSYGSLISTWRWQWKIMHKHLVSAAAPAPAPAHITIPVDVHLITLLIPEDKIVEKTIRVGSKTQIQHVKETVYKEVLPVHYSGSVDKAFDDANRIFSPADISFEMRCLTPEKVTMPGYSDVVDEDGFIFLAKQFPAKNGISLLLVAKFASHDLGGSSLEPQSVCSSKFADDTGRICAHEFGHLLGLEHLEKSGVDNYNLMWPGYSADTKLNPDQITKARGSRLAQQFIKVP